MILLLLLIILHLSLAQVRVLLISRFFVLIIKVIILSLILSEQILNTPFRVPMMYSRLKCGRPIPRLHFIMVWAFRLRLLRLLTGIMLFIPHLHIVVEDMRPEIILHIVVKTKSFHGIRVHLDIPRFLVLTMLKVNQSLYMLAPVFIIRGCGILAIRQHLRISIAMVFLFFRLSLLMLLLQISQTRRKLLSITIMSKTHGTAMCM